MATQSTTLGARLYEHINRAAKTHGTLDPVKIMYIFEESLTGDEYDRINGFLQWCHDEAKTFGSINYEERYTEYLAAMAVIINGAATESTEDRWSKIASDMLVGRKITAVRYLSLEEMEQIGWMRRSVVIQLDDGNIIYPSADDEGNDAGALFTNNEAEPVLPVI